VPVVNYALILLNSLFFVYQYTQGDAASDFLYAYGVIPYRFLHLFPSDPVELLTPLFAMFLHGGWLHVIGNMLYLYIFGDNIEDILGHGRYLAFYLVCGAASFLVQILLQANSMVPNVGASGAIAGVLGAYILLFPTARVVTLVPIFIFFTVVEIPAYIFLGIWFLIQFASGALTLGRTPALSGGVAWWAHIGGFLVGMILIKLMGAREKGRKPVVV
jgi:membrane associated rhomboid family serine protease